MSAEFGQPGHRTKPLEGRRDDLGGDARVGVPRCAAETISVTIPIHNLQGVFGPSRRNIGVRRVDRRSGSLAGRGETLPQKRGTRADRNSNVTDFPAGRTGCRGSTNRMVVQPPGWCRAIRMERMERVTCRPRRIGSSTRSRHNSQRFDSARLHWRASPGRTRCSPPARTDVPNGTGHRSPRTARDGNAQAVNTVGDVRRSRRGV